MKLIDEVEKWIQKTKDETKDWIIPQDLIQGIQSAKNRHDIYREIIRTVETAIDHTYFDAETLYRYFLGKYSFKAQNYSFGAKKEIMELIRNEMNQLKLTPNVYHHYFRNQMIKPRRDKLKQAISGKSTEAFTWIEKEEEEKMLKPFMEIAMLGIENVIRIKNEKRVLSFYQNLTSIAENPYAKDINLQEITRDYSIDLIAGGEENEGVKEFLKEWYQKKGKGILRIETCEEENYKILKSYFYLLNDVQKRRVKDKILKEFEEDFEKIKTLPREKRMNALVRMKEKINQVERWN